MTSPTSAGESGRPLLDAELGRIVRQLLQSGADAESIRLVVEVAIADRATAAVLRSPKAARATEPLHSAFDRAKYADIIGDHPAIVAVLALIDKIGPSTIPVLIQGESGTGKELIAKAVHAVSPRRDKPFVTENCAAIPETLLESELFGFKRGAFTGADRERKGLFQVADKGTLFLDEIGDMSAPMQSKLLRALQDGEIRPVGGTASIRVDVRVVSASNRLLRDMVARHQFREDLYYRLSGVTIELPALRERESDIPKLARHFLARICAEMRRAPPELSDDAIAALQRHRWPGNIRELENELRRCLALLRDESVIEAKHFSDDVRGNTTQKTQHPHGH